MSRPSFETALTRLLRGCEYVSDLILRSLRSKRLEGWTQRLDSRPSFETRAPDSASALPGGRAPQDEVVIYFSSASVDVAGPSPMISSTASSSLAPSQCTCLPKWVTKLPAGIGVVLAGSNFGPEPTHQVPCSTVM